MMVGIRFLRFYMVSTLLIYSASALAADGPLLNCNPPFVSQPLATRCREVNDYSMPAVVAGAQLRLYHFEDGFAGHPEYQDILRAIAESAIASIQLYSKFGKVPSISFLFSNKDGGNAWASADWSTQPCNITTYSNFRNNEAFARQSIAHEIFHCFQALNIRLPQGYSAAHSSTWWVEGSAEFFSNLVYPAADEEIHHEAKYWLYTPLTQQADPYSTSLFFQYLENKNPNIAATLVSQLRLQPIQSNPTGEMEALSQWSSMADLFHDFMKAIQEKRIKDSSGAGSPSLDWPIEQAMPLDMKSPGPSLGIKPFAYNGIALELQKGSHVELRMDPDDYSQGVRISYRKRDTQDWTFLSPTEPLRIDTQCLDEKNTILEFLVTGAGYFAPDKTVFLAQKSKARDCHCQAPKAALDPCVLGSWQQDNQATAALLKEFWVNWGESGGYAATDVTYTGASEYKIAVGKTMSTEKDTQSEALTTWTNKETGKLNIVGGETDALFTETFLQDDEKHLCIRFELGDGTYTGTTGGKKGKPFPVQDVIDAKLHTFEYSCKGNQMILWSIAGAIKMPARSLVRVKASTETPLLQ